MGAVSHGADADRLSVVGRELTNSSVSLSEMGTSGRAMAQVLAEHWSGADFEDFFGHGWPGAEQALYRSAELVRAMGEAAVRNAEEQRAVSEGATGAAGFVSTTPVAGQSTAPVTGQAMAGARPPAAESEPEGWEDPGLEGPDRGRLDPEVYERWQELEPGEKQAIIQRIVDEEAAAYGIEPAPEVQFEDIGGVGSWDGETLIIDATTVENDPREAIHAAAHETRHVVQREAMDMAHPPWWKFWKGREDMEGLNPDVVDRWKENERTGYQEPPDGELKESDPAAYEEQLKAYYEQPIEADAFDAGQRYVEDMTVEELERLRDESGG